MALVRYADQAPHPELLDPPLPR